MQVCLSTGTALTILGREPIGVIKYSFNRPCCGPITNPVGYFTTAPCLLAYDSSADFKRATRPAIPHCSYWSLRSCGYVIHNVDAYWRATTSEDVTNFAGTDVLIPLPQVVHEFMSDIGLLIVLQRCQFNFSERYLAY